MYGKLRQTDFLPVGEASDDEVLERGYHSASSSDDEGYSADEAFDEDNQEMVDVFDGFASQGYVLAVFFVNSWRTMMLVFFAGSVCLAVVAGILNPWRIDTSSR